MVFLKYKKTKHMRWIGRGQSDNVEDRRGLSGGGKVAAGGGIIGIIIALIAAFGGEQGQQLAKMANGMRGQQTQQADGPAKELTKEEIDLGNFVKTVFKDTEDTWAKIFAENGWEYEMPKMVLFYDGVNTSCGQATSAVGPFYCPADKKVYMDLRFFEELKSKFGAKGGDFAIAYVIAHEVGHHIQTITGTSSKVDQLQAGQSETEKNKLSVCQELQADYYAGMWANYNRQYLDVGDLEEALDAAHAVGDDAIQKRMQGHVVPDSFTHGTSAERKAWFTKGYNSKDIRSGNTYAEKGYRLNL